MLSAEEYRNAVGSLRFPKKPHRGRLNRRDEGKTFHREPGRQASQSRDWPRTWMRRSARPGRRSRRPVVEMRPSAR